jgi:hypothetical protein
MTITVNNTRAEYTATAGQTVFSYTFKIFEDTDLLVYQTADGDTPDDATDLITAYTVTGAGESAGGTIILTTGATLNDKITIVSAIPELRTTDYQYNADFSADVVNDDFDRVVSLVKQLSNKVDRTLLFDDAVQSASGLKFSAPVASQFLRWNTAADELESVSLNTAVGADNAAAISASTTGYNAFWTHTDVQGFMDLLIKPEFGTYPVLKRGIEINSGSAGSAIIGQAEINLSGATDGSYLKIERSGYTAVIGYSDATSSTRDCGLNISTADGQLLYMYGSTSGSNYITKFARDSGYIATINATSIQQKVLEWDNVAVKATKAFELPTYANLAAINAAITAPREGMLCYVTGQGMALYKASWVRTTDETTAIT